MIRWQFARNAREFLRNVCVGFPQLPDPSSVLPGTYGAAGRHTSCVARYDPRSDQALSTNLFVGNLSFSTTNDSLRSAFEEFGEVTSANVITDRETGRSRGFGFVEMASQEAANNAIEELDGSEIDGRRVNVNVARPRR